MSKKVITTSINLPVQSVNTILDIEDKNVEIPIKSALLLFEQNEKNSKENNDDIVIKSFNTIPYLPEAYMNQRSVPVNVITLNNDIFTITNIKKRPIEKTYDLKYFKVTLIFANDIKREFIVPSFVKFYSSRTGTFIPVEFLRSRHILMDYSGNIVKAEDSVLVENFEKTNYYTIKATYELDDEYIDSDTDKALPCVCNFYLNGVLVNIPYNNFQIKSDEN